MNLKQFSVTVLFLSILMLAPMIRIALALDSSTFWISSGVYPSASSYTIYNEGSYTYAKNAYGKNVYSGKDASQIIQNAIGQLTSGGTVFFSSGLYILSSTLNLTSGTTKGITLSGSKDVILQAKSNANLDAILKILGTHRMNIIKSLTFHGNENDNGTDRGIWIVSDATTPTTWVDVIECSFQYCPVGIECETPSGGMNTEHLLIQNNMFGSEEHTTVGIKLTTVRATRIIGNIIEDCIDCGLYSYDSGNIIIANNHFDDNHNYAIYLSKSSGHTISANFFEDTVTYDHIFVSSDSSDNVLSNNVVHTHGANRDCIRVEGQRNIIIGNNFYYNPSGQLVRITGDRNTVTGNNLIEGTNGIYVEGSYCVITSNFVKGCSLKGIVEAAPADYNLFCGCRSEGNVGVDIEIIGANTEIHCCWNGSTWIN